MSDSLGRYYTEQYISRMLINNISAVNPRTILDLGIGGGALTRAAIRRWNDASFYAIDIDHESIENIKKEIPKLNGIAIDGLSPKLSIKLKLKSGKVDVAICNPPYLKLDSGKDYSIYFKNTGLEDCVKHTRFTSDLLFLLQNLNMLKSGGELAIILPDSIITGHNYSKIRQSIINSHKLRCIIQLPDNVFPKTEARTYILYIQKNGTTEENIPIFMANKDGEIEKKILVVKSALIKRMDFAYNEFTRTLEHIQSIPLSQFIKKINRGSYSHKQLKLLCVPYYHASTKNLKINSGYNDNKNINGLRAKKGDILITRVGKRCIGNVILVEDDDEFLLSDCLIRITVEDMFRSSVFNALTSEVGKIWLKAHAHGVCSMVISQSDLLTFPIPISN